MESKKEKWSKMENSISVKMLVIGLLVILLLIPLSSIKSLIKERELRQKEVVGEINTKWGNNIFIYGPMLKVPYKFFTKKRKYNKRSEKYHTETVCEIKHAYLFPDKLDIQSDILSEKLNRGNYESVVYKNNMNFKGVFNPLSLSKKQIDKEHILWNKVSLIVSTSNLKGIQEELILKLNDFTVPMSADLSQKRNNLFALQSDFIPTLKATNQLTFNFNLITNGSEKFEVVPVGKVTTLNMKSNWDSPSFIGSYLPRTEGKKITKNGFDVNWKILQANRPFSQIHLKKLPNLKEFAFGTKFIVMANEYQQTERTAKYALLVICLTFVVFFIIQITSKINIHPFQYLMIGFALLMFYTLLISISEHSNYFKAYVIAASSVIFLISFYSKWILKSLKFSLFVASSLVVLYSFTYVIIQLENYSLLVGSVGLFIILAIVMFVSRNVDFGNKLIGTEE